MLKQISFVLIGFVFIVISQECIASAASSGPYELTAMLRTPPAVANSEPMKHAFSLVQSLERAPSCNRLAAASLIHSCKSLEDFDNGSDPETVLLDRIKSVFAARLAICELIGADAAVPKQCVPFSPVEKPAMERTVRCYLPGSNCAGKNEHRRSQLFEQAEISSCLSALESRPQWWTSYSNARQNAIAICHAARAEIEQGQSIDTYRSLTEVVSAASEALDESNSRWSKAQKDQARLAEALRGLQSGLYNDLAEYGTAMKARLASFYQQTEEQIRLLLGKNIENLNKAQSATKDLHANLKDASKEADAIKSQLNNAAGLASGSIELANTQQRALQHNYDLAIEIANAIATTRDDEMSSLTTTLATIQAGLQVSSNTMDLIVQRQSAHDAWLTNFSTSLESVLQSVKYLEDSHKDLASNQTEMLATMQAQMAAQDGQLDTLSGKMTALGTAIEEKTKAVLAMNGLFSSVGLWSSLAFALLLLILSLIFRIPPGEIKQYLIVSAGFMYHLGIIETGLAMLGPSLHGLQ